MSTRLEITPCSLRDAIALEQELGVSATVAQVLVRRGLADPDSARRFLAADTEHAPEAFGGLAAASELILAHVLRASPITVHGDYDVDGVCATAVMVRTLRRLGANVDWYLPDRAEGYGLTESTVARLVARGTRLLVTVDCAITAVAEVAAARAAGLDVVVSDHHTPRADGTLPDVPIVHPRLGGYPCPDLCATAVAHKLALALCAGGAQHELSLQEDLDLVALATIADVVPLLGENRTLVRRGLRALATTAKPGLRALMAVARVDPARVDERAVGFGLCPRLNAAGRLYRADAALELLLTEDPQRAKQVADELDHANHERRHTETRILFEAEAQVAELGERPAYVLAGEGWHAGVIGIVASRIAERHHRPAVCIALDGDAGRGSARSIPAFDLLGGLDACGKHLRRHGGHRAAAGLEIDRESLTAFTSAFTAHAQAVLTAEDLQRGARVDAIVGGDELSLTLAEELGRLGPFGRGNPAVSLLVPSAVLRDPRPMGEGRHVRFTVEAGGSRSRAVGFGTAGRLPVAEGEPADALFALEVDDYQGAVSARLVLRHAEPCSAPPVTVLGEPAQYLPGVWDELDGPLPGDEIAPGAGRRRVRDRRQTGVAGSLRAIAAGGEPVLVVCADAQRRREHLAGRIGGVHLCSHAALARGPGLAEDYAHLAVLDPPACAAQEALVRAGAAHTHVHLLWGEPERRFAALVHERDHDLRPSLAALYRRLRAAGSLGGADLEAALRGVPGMPGSEPRPAALAGRLLRVLCELELIEIDRARSAVTVRPAQPTRLERSVTFQAHARRLEEGRARLGGAITRAA